MIRWIARAGLVRLLGRRVVPLIVAYDLFRLVRSVARRRRPDAGD